jgi:hypothetical protein
MCSPRCPKCHTSSNIFLSHMLWLKLSFHCTPRSQCVPKVLKCVPQHGPKYHTFLSHVLWLKLNFHCTPSSQCVPQHGPKYHTSNILLSHVLWAKVELPLCINFQREVSIFVLLFLLLFDINFWCSLASVFLDLCLER